jgi:hypothetical protein
MLAVGVSIRRTYASIVHWQHTTNDALLTVRAHLNTTSSAWDFYAAYGFEIQLLEQISSIGVAVTDSGISVVCTTAKGKSQWALNSYYEEKQRMRECHPNVFGVVSYRAFRQYFEAFNASEAEVR